MTFDEIVSSVMDRLNLTSDEARVRIGIFVNERYKKLTTSIGLITSRRSTINLTIDPTNLTLYPNLPEITVTGLEKINKVWTLGQGNAPLGVLILRQLTYDEVTSRAPNVAVPRCWGIKRMGPGYSIITVDGTPATSYPLYFEGYDIAPTLSGETEPCIPTDFDDILIEGAKADELSKMEKPSLAEMAETKYETRLGDLRYFIAKSAWLDIVQGKDRPRNFWNAPWYTRLPS